MNDLFKSYDVRGIYPTEINEDIVRRIGRAFAEYTGAKKVAVGRDNRSSSPSLFASLASGLTEAGVDVIDLGLLSTPMLYFASSKLPVDGALMVTASHNPGEYNGIKFTKKNAVPIGLSSGLSEIRDIALAGNFIDTEIPGNIATHDIKPMYEAHIASFAQLNNKNFRIATDTAHAMGVLELPILNSLQGVVSSAHLYDTLEIPGVCPHEANPMKAETLVELQNAVRETQADLGIAFDGDADRVGFVDEKGSIIRMDIITALLAEALLSDHDNAIVLYDLRSSRAIKEAIELFGGIAHECRVGHAHIKKQMIEEGALLAGEASGHYYFALSGYVAEMGTLPALLIMNLMARTGKPLSELVREIARYAHSGEINLRVAAPDKVFAILKEHYHNGALSELDGIKIEFPTWWFSIRASNTEPLVRLNIEASTPELLEEKKKELLDLVNGA